MKWFFRFFFLLASALALLVSCNDLMSTPNPNHLSSAAIPWHYIIAGLLALYEIIVRLIPSVANISIVHWIIEFLKWLDSLLTRNKSKS
jgi:hypothetical protein